jgi:hypothetical protein
MSELSTLMGLDAQAYPGGASVKESPGIHDEGLACDTVGPAELDDLCGDIILVNGAFEKRS